LRSGAPALEKHLESWIEQDPSIIGDGLVIVGRQITIGGVRLDLLALDVRGRWLAIEVKAGRLYREVVAQALDYSASLAALDIEQMRRLVGAGLSNPLSSDALERANEALSAEASGSRRDVVAVVVGTGADSGLERLTSYLAGYNVPLKTAVLTYFDADDGSAIVMREIVEAEADDRAPRDADARYQSVLSIAEQEGTLNLLTRVVEWAKHSGFYPRPYVRSIMITPPDKRNRMLFVVAVRKKRLQLYRSADAIAEFLPNVTPALATQLLGPDGWMDVDEGNLQQYLTGLDQLLLLSTSDRKEGDEADGAHAERVP
jgi:hypothetical protein